MVKHSTSESGGRFYWTLTDETGAVVARDPAGHETELLADLAGARAALAYVPAPLPGTTPGGNVQGITR